MITKKLECGDHQYLTVSHPNNSLWYVPYGSFNSANSAVEKSCVNLLIYKDQEIDTLVKLAHQTVLPLMSNKLYLNEYTVNRVDNSDIKFVAITNGDKVIYLITEFAVKDKEYVI